MYLQKNRETMKALKTQHPNETDAKNCAEQLTKSKVKCIRLGGAVVSLSDMHNNLIIVNTSVDHRGYFIGASESDKDNLVKSL
jgi:hypothetical protein